MRTHQKDSWINWNRIDWITIESLVKPNELSHEGHIWISNLSSFTNEVQSIVKSCFICENHICQAHSSTSRNTLDTMNKNSTSFFLGCIEKVNNIIETTFDILSSMIFEIKTEILNSFLNVVVSTIASCTVQYMSYTIILQFFVVLGHDVRSQIQELRYDFTTNFVIHCVLVSFSGCSLVIKFFVKLFKSCILLVVCSASVATSIIVFISASIQVLEVQASLTFNWRLNWFLTNI